MSVGVAYRLLSFGGVELPEFDAKWDVPRRANVQRAQLVGMGSAILGIRASPQILQASGVLVRGYTWDYDADRQLDKLNALIGTESDVRMKTGDESIRVRRCILTSVQVENVAAENGGVIPVSIEFDTVDEYWHGDGLTPRVFTSVTAIECGNMGNVAQWERLKLTITSATLTGLVITNTRNGQYCTVNTAKASGDLILDVGTMLATANSVDIYASVSFPATQTRFLQLEPGANRLTFSQTVTGRIEYRACWR